MPSPATRAVALYEQTQEAGPPTSCRVRLRLERLLAFTSSLVVTLNLAVELELVDQRERLRGSLHLGDRDVSPPCALTCCADSAASARQRPRLTPRSRGPRTRSSASSCAAGVAEAGSTACPPGAQLASSPLSAPGGHAATRPRSRPSPMPLSHRGELGRAEAVVFPAAVTRRDRDRRRPARRAICSSVDRLGPAGARPTIAAPTGAQGLTRDAGTDPWGYRPWSLVHAEVGASAEARLSRRAGADQRGGRASR